jgi:high-affinity Fe2+/Pb2+ permease
MIASDWIEMAQTADSNTIASFGILITLMSGYLVVAYLVGEKLNRAQVTTVNLLYAISAVSVVAAHWQHNYDSMLARHHAYTYIPDMSGSVPPALMILIPSGLALINISLIIASLYFMWSIRHPKTE